MPNSDGYCALVDHFDEMVWLQFTGLKDRNGVEIFEADIYKTFGYDHTYQVRFLGAAFCGGETLETSRPICWDEEDLSLDEEWINRGLEVIGNIYENPELLEEVPNE